MGLPALASVIGPLARAAGLASARQAAASGGSAAAKKKAAAKAAEVANRRVADKVAKGTEIAGNANDLRNREDDSQQSKEQQEAAREEGRGKLKETFKKLTKGGLAAAAALVSLPTIVKKLGSTLLASQEHLSVYNAEINRSLVQLRRDRIVRDIRTGAQTAGSVRQLAESQSRLEEAMQPLAALGTNIANSLVANVQDGIAEMIDNLKELPFIREKIAELEAKVGDEHQQVFHFLNELAQRRLARDAAEEGAGGNPAGVGGDGIVPKLDGGFLANRKRALGLGWERFSIDGAQTSRNRGGRR